MRYLLKPSLTRAQPAARLDHNDPTYRPNPHYLLTLFQIITEEGLESPDPLTVQLSQSSGKHRSVNA